MFTKHGKLMESIDRQVRSVADIIDSIKVCEDEGEGGGQMPGRPVTIRKPRQNGVCEVSKERISAVNPMPREIIIYGEEYPIEVAEQHRDHRLEVLVS